MIRTKLALSQSVIVGISVISLSTFAFAAQAFTLVSNGDFESTTGPAGQLGYTQSGQATTNATGWTNNGYNFIFSPGSADTTGVTGQFGNLKLWGPGNGSANGLPASSPTGGNFIAADGAFGQGAISQTINGLTKGKSYTLEFYWAGAQQFGFSGITTEQWKVSFAGQTKFTEALTNASQGFTGWRRQTFEFVADDTTSLLSFLAVGTPDGLPPFSLLDGVILNETVVPEPAIGIPAMLLVAGLIGVRLARKNA